MRALLLSSPSVLTLCVCGAGAGGGWRERQTDRQRHRERALSSVSSYKGTNAIMSPMLITSSKPNYLPKGPTCKYHHIGEVIRFR